jgi:protein involved in polysaccharide export with SLBB domain
MPAFPGAPDGFYLQGRAPMNLTKVTSVLALFLILAPLAVSKATVHAIYQDKAYIFAFGEVNKPGAFEFTEGMTIRRAVVLFKGTTSNADISRMVISRKDRSEIAVDLAAVMKGRNEDVALLAGDVIVVPSLTKAHFFVAGEANKPGVFEFSEGMTLRQAAVLFEGMTSKASLSRTVILRKDHANGMRSRIPVDLEGVMQGKKDDMGILVDDVIIIPEFGVSKLP